MKSKNTVLCIMAIILFINFLTFEANALILSPEEIERIEMLLKENDAYVHDEDKKVLEGYKEKLLNYEILNQEEKDYLRECYLNMIKHITYFYSIINLFRFFFKMRLGNKSRSLSKFSSHCFR